MTELTYEQIAKKLSEVSEKIKILATKYEKLNIEAKEALKEANVLQKALKRKEV